MLNGWNSPERSITLRVGSIRMRWVFNWKHDRDQMVDLIPWIMRDVEFKRIEGTNVDFTIGVYGWSTDAFHYFRSLPGIKMFINGEAGVVPASNDIIGFSSGCRKGNKWAPTMVFWTPPTSRPKTKCCSAIERGAYPRRNSMIEDAARQIGDVDCYGALFGNPLPGAHGPNNKKYLGLQDYAFSIGIENRSQDDYVTEKLFDIALNEAVAIYHGAPNWHNYFLDHAVIPYSEIASVNWREWRSEYGKRRHAVLLQKEIIRSVFNVIRYFIILAQHPELFAEERPLTLRNCVSYLSADTAIEVARHVHVP